MIRRLRFVFRYYLVEMIVVPPFVMLLCYLLYGDDYWHSWRNFARMTGPWFVMGVLSPIACHWVRSVTLKRFTRLEEWPKRVIWSILGYLFFTVGFAQLTYFVLTTMRYSMLAPTQKSFYILLILTFMCVLITATLYESVTYFDKWKTAISETEQLEKLTLESQFQSLQSQLQPHFLFNSLNVLSSLITENPRRAEDFVDELSNVYRYLLRSNERELTSVGEEVRFIRSFFHLLETRHDRGIALNIDIGKAGQNQKLPALALQILVENAVKHNELSPEKPLLITIREEPGAGQTPLKIIVRNNLQRKSTRGQSNHVGLDNLRQRYDLLGVAGFEVLDDGRFFTVVLPLIPAPY